MVSISFQSIRRAVIGGAAVALVVGAVALTAQGVGVSVLQGPPSGTPIPRDFMGGPAAQPAAGTAVVSGTVLSSDLNRPVRRATVRLSTTTPSLPLTTTTDDQGRFQFEKVAAGQFVLSASKPGYLDSTYGQRRPGSGRPGTPLSIAEGQRLERLSVPIARGGVLAGTVLDEGGEPAFGTDVRAMKYVWQNGERVLRVAGATKVDDRGNFRIGQLPPGDYVVVATPTGDAGMMLDAMGLVPQLAATDALRVISRQTSFGQIVRAGIPVAGMSDSATNGYTPVYYPGTTSAANATTIALGLTEERSAVDVQLQLVPMGRITGTVVGDGTGNAGTDLQLLNLDQTLPGLGVRAARADADGRFTFADVPPGRYRVRARSGPRRDVIVDQVGGETRVMMQVAPSFVVGGRGATPGPGPGGLFAMPPMDTAGRQRWGIADVALTGGDTQTVAITLQAGMTVSGRVVFNGSDAAPTDLSRMQVVLNSGSQSEGNVLSASGVVGPDGRFTVNDVMPGKYRVAVIGNAWRPRSFEAGGEDALDFLLTVEPDKSVSDAVLTMTTRSTTLSGTLQQATGQPIADYTILVFAEDPRYWTPQSRRIQATRPATDGRFSFRGLPAGDYRMVAVEDLEDGQSFDQAILRQLAPAAVRVTIGDGETKTQDLRVR